MVGKRVGVVVWMLLLVCEPVVAGPAAARELGTRALPETQKPSPAELLQSAASKITAGIHHHFSAHVVRHLELLSKGERSLEAVLVKHAPVLGGVVERVLDYEKDTMAEAVAEAVAEVLQDEPSLRDELTSLLSRISLSPSLSSSLSSGPLADIAHRVLLRHNITWPRPEDGINRVAVPRGVEELVLLQEGEGDGRGCSPGLFWDGDACVACSGGTFKGRFGPEPCTPCVGCGAGEFLSGCGPLAAGSCEACPAGKFKLSDETSTTGQQAAQTTCSDCTPCPLGFYRAHCGGGSEGECVACMTDEACGEGRFATQCGEFEDGVCSECVRTDRACYADAHPNARGLPWFATHNQMFVEARSTCEATTHAVSGACADCTQCSWWVQLWVKGACEGNVDQKCFSPLLKCGTSENRFLFLGGMVLFALMGAFVVIRPVVNAVEGLYNDIKNVGALLIVVYGVLEMISALPGIMQSMGFEPSSRLNSVASGSERTSAVLGDKFRGAQFIREIDWSAFSSWGNFKKSLTEPSAEAFRWPKAMYIVFTVFFAYVLLRLWLSDLLDDLCIRYTNPLSFIPFLLLLLSVLGWTSCNARYSVVEDVANMFWAGVAFFLFGRVLTIGSRREIKRSCFLRVVMPKFFMLNLMLLLPVAGSATLIPGKANVLAKTAVLVAALAFFSLMRKIKSSVLPYKCRSGPKVVENGAWASHTTVVARRNNQNLRKDITCGAGFYQVDSLAVCKCKREGNDHCEDLVGQQTPCQPLVKPDLTEQPAE